MGEGGLSFACSCGAVSGHVDAAPAQRLHFACHCRDCAAAMRHFGQPDPGEDGVPILWVAPDQVHIDHGAEHLAAIRLTKAPLLRWYASCCGAPMFNFMVKPRLFVLGLLADRITERSELGPLVAHAFMPQPGGKTRHEGSARLFGYVLSRTISAALRRRWGAHPFLDDTGRPIREARKLSPEERAAAMAPASQG